MALSIISFLRRFRRNESGAALVELGISLPLVLLFFAVIVEGSRVLWAFQATSAGVRDAARYLSRIAPRDICATGAAISDFAGGIEAIVTQSSSGSAFFPASVTITGVGATLTCVAGSYRDGPAAIAQVSANVAVALPFNGLFLFAGQTVPAMSTTVSDQARIYGS